MDLNDISFENHTHKYAHLTMSELEDVKKSLKKKYKKEAKKEQYHSSRPNLALRKYLRFMEYFEFRKLLESNG